MNNSKEGSERLEQAVDRTLRDLPPRQAPVDLQMRVMAEIQRRAALPWWRRHFVHWPMIVRVVFLVLCVVLADASMALMRWLSATPRGLEIPAVVSQPLTWLERLDGVLQATQAFLELLARHVPMPLLYGGLVSVALLYGALVGIGAVAYRTLYAQR